VRQVEITKVEDLKKGEVIELPMYEGRPLVVRLRRPSLLQLIKTGAIPNELLAMAQEMFEGKQRSDIKQYIDVLDKVIEAALIEPEYSELKDILTDTQKLAIYSYTQQGVAGLRLFRKIEELPTDSGSGKEDKPSGKPNSKD